MELAIIVAQSKNRVIGVNNDLPWRLPKDLQYFKKVTLGKPIIMGRKTFESIGRALPGRTNIVISRNPEWVAPEGVKLVTSIDEAIALAESIAVIDGSSELMIIGGAQIYKEAIKKDLIDQLDITLVHHEFEADAFFPEIDLNIWEETKREDFKADEKNKYDYSFVSFTKKTI